MPVPSPPPSLEELGRRPFSFYPAILNIEHNEWQFRSATWSEIQVVNTATNLELWIPRRYLKEISRIEDPVMIVGLQKELRYQAGTVWPNERQVLEMHPPVNIPTSPSAPVQAPAKRIRLETAAEKRIGRLILGVLVFGVIAFVLSIAVFRGGGFRSSVVLTAKDQAYLELSRTDDYFAVVSKLGLPGDERWRAGGGEIYYRALWYPERAYWVLLMGPERESARYIGSVDGNWNVLHYVSIPGGGNTRSMLRSIGKF